MVSGFGNPLYFFFVAEDDGATGAGEVVVSSMLVWYVGGLWPRE